MSVETLKNQLKILRLPTALTEIEDVLAKYKKAVNLTWIIDLFEKELDARRENSLRQRLKAAAFPEITSLENFDWNFNPKIDEGKVRDLATLKFMEENQIALMLGKPGTGKTHIAIAIGVDAVRAGHRVFWTSAKRLSSQIMLAKAKNNLDILFKKILSARLWIIDDWGVITMNREIAEEVFDLLDRRKHNSAMILTSNRDINEWGEVFPDPVIANATIDRIFDRAKIAVFEGPSYRLKGRIQNREIDTSMKLE